MEISPEPHKTTRSVQILLMRHGQSTLNKLQTAHAASNGLHSKYASYANRWLTSPDLINATLTAEGERDCEGRGQALQGVRHVLVSPLRRAVQTAVMAMADRRDGEQVSWRVFPWGREVMMCNCDIGLGSEEFLEGYPYIDAAEIKGDPLWFMNYYYERDENTNLKEKVRVAYEADPRATTILSIMKDEFPYFEGPKQLNKRAQKLKDEFKKFINEKEKSGTPVKDGEILFVGHSRMLRHLLGVFTDSGEIISENEVYFENADIKPYQIEY
jgi:broad specificity phosphatase PhoE